MRTPVWFLLALAIVIGVAVWWLSSSREATQPVLEAPVPTDLPTPLPEPAMPEAVVRYEVPASEDRRAEPLPILGQSDSLFRERLYGAVGGPQPLERWLMPNALIQRLVVTLDSLDQSLPVALRMRPLAHVPGLFQVGERGEQLHIHEDNARRYALYVDLFAAADPRELAALYFGLYPLFQEAYEELGYTGRYFNDRLVDIIDHLLETPELAPPLLVVRPRVQYQFVDADTEARSWGQKTLIRMGRDHQWRVKAQLRALRAELIGQPPVAPTAMPDEADEALPPPGDDVDA